MTDKAKKEMEVTTVERQEDLPVFTPATDIYEKTDSILVRCDMPGVDQQNLEITLEDNILTLTGTQTLPEPEGHDELGAEYEPGIFQRSFAVAQDIDADGITARIKNGVLDIHLPKSKKAQPRRIAVEAASEERR